MADFCHIEVPRLSDPANRCSVAASRLADGVYLVHADNEDDSDWLFKQRSLVRCRVEQVAGEAIPVAYEQVFP